MAIDGEECAIEFRVDPRFPMDNPQESIKMDKSFDRLDLKSRPFRLSGKRKDDIDPKDFKNYREFSLGWNCRSELAIETNRLNFRCLLF